MREGERHIGSSSELLGRRRRKRKSTTFSSSKQRRERELQKKQIQGSRIVEGELSWRLGCNIHCRVERSLLWEITGSLAAADNDFRVGNQLFSKPKIIIKQTNRLQPCPHQRPEAY